MVDLKVGTRLRSVVCGTEIVVVRAPPGEVEVTCGGAPMETVGGQPEPAQQATATTTGTAVGKRYVDESVGLEVLCTKAGDGDLACSGTVLEPKGAKPLPSSD